jgi:hypothetical protein
MWRFFASAALPIIAIAFAAAIFIVDAFSALGIAAPLLQWAQTSDSEPTNWSKSSGKVSQTKV